MTFPLTCCCVLTPPGTGAIGIIRVQGNGALLVVAKIFQSKCGKPLTEDLLAGGRLRYGWIVDNGERIDDVLVSCPCSTDEEAVDISAHGGVRIIERILGALEAAGAVVSSSPPRASDVWPSTNIIKAEALDALVRAKTERAVHFLSWQRQHLAQHLRRVAASIENDTSIAKIALGDMLAAYNPARVLVEGATVVLVGPPNSGKSTLFNALLGREGAVVSDIAGTTRDYVVGDVEMLGVPIQLIDTAGQCDTQDNLERQAVDAGRDWTSKADVVVVVLDASETISPSSSLIEQFTDVSCDRFVVLNKVDLLSPEEFDNNNCSVGSNMDATVAVSAKKLVGLEEFAQLLLARLGLVNFETCQPAFFTKRQVELAHEAQDLLDQPDIAARFILDILIGASQPIRRST